MSAATARGVRAAVAVLLAAWLVWAALQARDGLLVAGLAALGAVFVAWAVLEVPPRLSASIRGAVAVVGAAALAGSLVLIIAWVVATGGG